MDAFLKIALPVYALCYVIFLLVVRSMAVSRKIGKSPVVVSYRNNTIAQSNKYFKVFALIFLAVLLAGAFLPVPYVHDFLHYHLFRKLPYLDSLIFQIAGLALLIISFSIVFLAQIQMRNSFRVGIDQDTRTDLVSSGLFRFSRNPIYVGMLLTFAGLFLIYPNFFTLLLFVISYVLIRLQVSLEEAYLFQMHSQAFLDYKQKVRRFV
jgi:protein-S-isoprenylcysteine O-methyltransferase Ste14